jgi:hypothetical protein
MKDRIMITTNKTYPWSFVTQIFTRVTTVNNRDKENIVGNINDNVRRGTNDGKLWNEKFICT